MCGIVGYIGNKSATPIVLEGLRRLEYRGYDSSGIAIMSSDGSIQVRREVGKLQNLMQSMGSVSIPGDVGIGHTRWATHGPPCERNAHPHSSPDRRFAVVQNGIVENFADLRSRLQSQGYMFLSDTDTETIVHLLHYHYNNGCNGDLEAAVCKAMADLKGPSAIVVVSQDYPDRLIAARLGNAGGIAIGLGDGECFIASDVPAILHYTRRVIFLENRQVCVVTREGARCFDLDRKPLVKHYVEIEWDALAAEKGEYKHHMQKEIFEQGTTLNDTLRGRIDFSRNRVVIDSLNMTHSRLNSLKKITIVACGTSYYSGLVGKFMIEHLAQLPVEVDYASEFRYRSPLLDPSHMVLAVTQSGETVDTLAALDEGRSHGAYTTAIVNVVGSQAERTSNGVIHMQVGPEIGVASTKAFTASVTDLFLLSLYLGQERGVLDSEQLAKYIQMVSTLPGLAGELLESAMKSGFYSELAAHYSNFHNFLYIGRGINYPVALEGALKLKEISYVHAEGYPAGEMKHGPIALIDDRMPTVVIVPEDSVHDKMVSQIEQVKARGGRVLAVANESDEHIRNIVDVVMPIPSLDELLTPILAVLPLQLLAYEIALCRGTNIDQPRNLAKSVTVE